MDKSLDNIEVRNSEEMYGNEEFTYKDKSCGLTMLDFWRWHFSEKYDLQCEIAEYIVARALGIKRAHNVGVWTLYDIEYRGKRIEIKETSYYHAWQKEDDEISMVRTFGIGMANSDYETHNKEDNKYERQNDIYVFCLNTGFNRLDSDPLKLENWEFYIVPTSVINENCGENKTISLGRVKELSNGVTLYDQLKEKIDLIIDDFDLNFKQ